MAELFSSIANAAKSFTQNTDLRQFTDKIQGMVLNLSPVEQCVWDATNEEPWGPTGPQMKEVCNYTYQYDQFFGVMNMLYKRMLEDNKNAWRRVYKSLVLLNYLLQHGSERVVSSAKDNLFHIRALESYKFTDEKGKDQGINIRHRAKIVIDLLQDDDKLRAERKKAKGDSKEKYQGYTPDDIRMGRGSGGGGSGSSWKDNDKWDDDFKETKKYDKRKYSWEEEGEEKREKEVNAFEFTDERRRDSASPELGFRDEKRSSHRVDDDDDFGDFASARSSTKPQISPATSTPTKISAPPTSLGRISVPGGQASAIKVSPKLSAPAPVSQPIASFDLLNLDAPAPQVSPAAPAVDLFAQMPTSTTPVVTSVSRPPRPPSGGGPVSPNVSNGGGALIDDLFGSSTAPVTASAPSNGNNGFDIFGGAPTTPSNDFGDFGSFSSSTPTQNIPSSNTVSAGLDFLSSGPIQPSPAMGLTPSASFPMSHGGPTLATAATQNQDTQKPQAKVGSTWTGTSGLIDLDNLGNRNPQKKVGVPMNQMQQKTQPSQGGLNW